MNSPSWLEIAGVLAAVAQALHLEWRCELPPFDTLPSAALDEECDAWCQTLAANLGEPLHPPEMARPWILARLVSMSACAKANARDGAIPPPALTPSIVAQFLIGEWHGCLRDRWPLMMPLPFDEI